MFKNLNQNSFLGKGGDNKKGGNGGNGGSGQFIKQTWTPMLILYYTGGDGIKHILTSIKKASDQRQDSSNSLGSQGKAASYRHKKESPGFPSLPVEDFKESSGFPSLPVEDFKESQGFPSLPVTDFKV